MITETNVLANSKPVFDRIPINLIRTDEYNIRRKFSEENPDDKELVNIIEDVVKNNPIVVIKNSDGTFDVISGHRRIEATKLKGMTHINAIIYDAETITVEERFALALEDNIGPNKLKAGEKCLFLYKAKTKTGLSDAKIADKYGKRMDIQSGVAVNKYIKVAKEIIVKDDSPEIKKALFNDDIPFAIASDELAPMDVQSRNAFFKLVLEPNKLTRPEAKEIKKVLVELKAEDETISDVIARGDVKEALKKVKDAKDGQKKSDVIINGLKALKHDPQASVRNQLNDSIRLIREKVSDDIHIDPSSHLEKNALRVKFDVTDDNFDQISTGIIEIMKKGGDIETLLSIIVSPDGK